MWAVGPQLPCMAGSPEETLVCYVSDPNTLCLFSLLTTQKPSFHPVPDLSVQCYVVCLATGASGSLMYKIMNSIIFIWGIFASVYE